MFLVKVGVIEFLLFVGIKDELVLLPVGVKVEFKLILVFIEFVDFVIILWRLLYFLLSFDLED